MCLMYVSLFWAPRSQLHSSSFIMSCLIYYSLCLYVSCHPLPKENDQCWRVRSRSCWQYAHSKARTVGGIQAAHRPSSVWTCAAIADLLISAPDKQEDTWCKSAIGRYISMRYTAQPRMTISAAYIKWVQIEYIRECQLKYHWEPMKKLLIGKSSPNGRNSYLDENFDEIFQGTQWDISGDV